MARFNPIKWARNLIFMCLLALDFKHIFEFVDAMSLAHQAHQTVILFGPLMQQLGLQVTNGTFDALAYALTITATIYFMSNTLAHRLAHGEPSKMFWAAMIAGTALSALANAGTMFYGATGNFLIGSGLIGIAACILGAVVTFGLLMFASMDSWDMKAKLERQMARREAKRVQRERDAKKHPAQRMSAEERKEKYTPKKFRNGLESVA